MIQWIRDTFFPTDDIEQLLDKVEHLQRQVAALESSESDRFRWHYAAVKRLRDEAQKVLTDMEKV